MDCNECRLLLHGYVDGESTPEQRESVEDHLTSCAACVQEHEGILAASVAVRGLPYQTVPAELRLRFAGSRTQPSRWGLHFGAGFATASAVFVLALVLLFHPFRSNLATAAVELHIQSLMAGNHVSVVSSDRHTVKPWFDGKINFAPPVYNLKDKGFELVGGRVDHLAGHAVASLIFKHGLHPMTVFILPSEKANDAPASAAVRGYNVVSWHQDQMELFAVSDMQKSSLLSFASAYQNAAMTN